MSETETEPISATTPRRRIPVYVQSFLFLLCGLIIGSGLTAVFIRGALQQMVQNPELLPERILQRMDLSLDLDDEQRAAVEEIVERHMAGFREIRQRVRPEIQAELDALRSEVSAELTPEQREEWEARFDALRARWQPGG